MAATISSFGSVSSSFDNVFIVTGSGDAKISASTMDFNSDIALFSTGHGLKRRRVLRLHALVDANRSECALLEHPDRLQPDHLEQCQERDNHAGAGLDVGKQVLEPASLGLRQALEQLLDAGLDRDL